VSLRLRLSLAFFRRFFDVFLFFYMTAFGPAGYSFRRGRDCRNFPLAKVFGSCSTCFTPHIVFPPRIFFTDFVSGTLGANNQTFFIAFPDDSYGRPQPVVALLSEGDLQCPSMGSSFFLFRGRVQLFCHCAWLFSLYPFKTFLYTSIFPSILLSAFRPQMKAGFSESSFFSGMLSGTCLFQAPTLLVVCAPFPVAAV